MDFVLRLAAEREGYGLKSELVEEGDVDIEERKLG